MPYRSAKTGRYISEKAAKRSPSTTVKESSKPSSGKRTVHRSAKTGQFTTSEKAKRSPSTTLKEIV